MQSLLFLPFLEFHFRHTSYFQGPVSKVLGARQRKAEQEELKPTGARQTTRQILASIFCWLLSRKEKPQLTMSNNDGLVLAELHLFPVTILILTKSAKTEAIHR
eukprot:1137707-Pelagomonas_calceolata.AAC.2